MANQKNLNYLGYKLFRFEEGEQAKICRVIRAYNNGKVMIEKENGDREKVVIDDMKEEGWEILSAPGLITASIVEIKGNEDVVITFHKQKTMLAVDRLPEVICRQSVTDFFYSFLSSDEKHPFVGVSVSQKTCPTNIQYQQLLACDDIEYSVVAHTYLDDTIDDFIKIINPLQFDAVLYQLHAKYLKDKNPMWSMRNMVHGWCTTLKLLLETNNFGVDVDQCFGISTVDFDVEENLVEKKDVAGVTYHSFNPDATLFFMRNYKINITDNYVIPYGYDIDFSQYKHTHYLLIRSNNGKVYMMVYMCDGEYIETDLEIAAQEEQIASSLNLHLYNKYRKNKK